MAAEVMCVEGDSSNHKLFELRVNRGLVLDEPRVTQHVQECRLASIVETKEKDVGLQGKFCVCNFQLTTNCVTNCVCNVLSIRMLPSCLRSPDSPEDSRTS